MKKTSDFKITVVYDNNPYKEKLETSWGFACVVETPKSKILFDTGADGDILLSNMEKMEIDTDSIDFVVISHDHYDHTGGLHKFLDVNSNVTVFILGSFSASFKDSVKEKCVKVVEVKDSMQICDGVYSTGELGDKIKEQSLLVESKHGFVVITGCAHPGIVKIVEEAKRVLPGDLSLIVGGFHLLKDDAESIRNVVEALKRLGVNKVGPCHCSGEAACSFIKQEYGQNYVDVGVGKVIVF